MFISKSKIHFESKSQLKSDQMRKKKSCLSVSQRYILKANHNSCCLFVIYLKLFISKSKIHFESKSQPNFGYTKRYVRCLSVSQRYILKTSHNKLKSAHNIISNFKYFKYLQTSSRLSVSRRYILKANHNSGQPVNYFIGGSPYYSSSEPDGKTHNTPKCG